MMSFPENLIIEIPDIFSNTSIASFKPDLIFGGKSICDKSPVTQTLEFSPIRVRNIFIWAGVVFCASSRITKELAKVLPRIKASGATSI